MNETKPSINVENSVVIVNKNSTNFKKVIKLILLTLLILFDLFIVIINFWPAKKDITTPGGLNEVKDMIEIEDSNEIKGSFNTLYVYSYDKASILKTFLASKSPYNDISDSSTTSNLSYQERVLAGKIQKNQSIECSLIAAYNYAKVTNPDINLNYHLEGFYISYRQINQKDLEIGDLIYGVIRDDVTYDNTNPIEFVSALNSLKIGDIILYIRNDKKCSYNVEVEFSSKNLNRISMYSKYFIDEENAYPKYKLHKSNTLGPSGGLLQTLSVYCQITGIDLTKGKKICGTGTISASGYVGEIGGISQKVVTALRADADVFLCPKENAEEGYATYLKEKGNSKMEFIVVSTFEEAVIKLGELE